MSPIIITVDLYGVAIMDLEIPRYMKLEEVNEKLLSYWGDFDSGDRVQFMFEKSVNGSWGIWWEKQEGTSTLAVAGFRDGAYLRIKKKETAPMQNNKHFV